MITATRYHDISCGHRVVGHESKCKHLHGHNYRFHFHITANELDDVGRVLDFGVIKSKLCEFLENVYDHRTLIWSKDPLANKLEELFGDDICLVPFNPTAENIAQNFVEEIAPYLLAGTDCTLIKLELEETRKCKATYEIKS